MEITKNNTPLGIITFCRRSGVLKLDLPPDLDSLCVPRKKCEEHKEEMKESDQGRPELIQASSWAKSMPVAFWI